MTTGEVKDVKKYWISELLLFPEDLKCIQDNDWLTDSVIDAAQFLLKKQFPNVCGLQSVVLGQNLAFNVMKGDFVQIIIINKSHWITISCRKKSIDVYDSKPSVNFPTDGKEQIAALVCSERKQIIINMKPVQ